MSAQPKTAENMEKDSRQNWLTGLVRRLSKLTTRDRDTWQSLPSFRSCRDFFLGGREGGGGGGNIGQRVESRGIARFGDAN